MTEKKDTNAADAVFPGPIRHRPEFFISGKGRVGVYHLIDHLLRSVCWGYDRSAPGSLSIDVKTDGTLLLKRKFENQGPLFEKLKALKGDSSGSLANDLFRQCVQEINAKKISRSDFVPGNPFFLNYLPMMIALSTRAKLSLTEGGSSRVQNYRDGIPTDSVAHSRGENSAIELEAVLDSELLQEEVRAYPFRVRVQELACLFPGIGMDVKYKGFAPLTYKAESGMKDLVNSIVPEDNRIHPEPFEYRGVDGDTTFEVALYLVISEMEKIKCFAGFDESCHGGVHDECLREVLSDLLHRLYRFQVPDRRQSLDNIAASRMTYFGALGSTVPFQKEHRGNQFVKIIPGLASCIRLSNPKLEWEKGGGKSRLVGPSLNKVIQPDLTVEFRRWLLERPELFNEWKLQWAPKKRRRRTPPTSQTKE